MQHRRPLSIILISGFYFIMGLFGLLMSGQGFFILFFKQGLIRQSIVNLHNMIAEALTFLGFHLFLPLNQMTDMALTADELLIVGIFLFAVYMGMALFTCVASIALFKLCAWGRFVCEGLTWLALIKTGVIGCAWIYFTVSLSQVGIFEAMASFVKWGGILSGVIFLLVVGLPFYGILKKLRNKNIRSVFLKKSLHFQNL